MQTRVVIIMAERTARARFPHVTQDSDRELPSSEERTPPIEFPHDAARTEILRRRQARELQ